MARTLRTRIFGDRPDFARRADRDRSRSGKTGSRRSRGEIAAKRSARQAARLAAREELNELFPTTTPAQVEFEARKEAEARWEEQLDREIEEFNRLEELERQRWIERGASEAALHLFDDPSYVKWLERNNPEYLQKVWGVDEDGRFLWTREMELAHYKEVAA